jgi:2-methylcitrate dehydratase PrpD
VRVRTPTASVQPLIHHRPQDGLQGKFSLEYAVATAILDEQQGFEAFSDEAVRRLEAQRLVGLVETTLVDHGDSLLSGLVEIDLQTDDGVIHASLDYPPGSPQRPPDEEEMGQKVALCLAGSGVNAQAISWADGGELLRRTLVGP